MAKKGARQKKNEGCLKTERRDAGGAEGGGQKSDRDDLCCERGRGFSRGIGGVLVERGIEWLLTRNPPKESRCRRGLVIRRELRRWEVE